MQQRIGEGETTRVRAQLRDVFKPGLTVTNLLILIIEFNNIY